MNQLQKGIRVEMEHKGLAKKIERFEHKNNRLPSDRQVSKMIATTHLKEDKKYYYKLSRAKL